VTDSTVVIGWLKQLGVASPLLASFWVPLDASIMNLPATNTLGNGGQWAMVLAYFGVTALMTSICLGLIAAILGNRWGMTGR
jgi:hypothetical protein